MEMRPQMPSLGELPLAGQAEPYNIVDLRNQNHIPKNIPVEKKADGNYYITVNGVEEKFEDYVERINAVYEDSAEDKAERRNKGYFD